MTSSSEHNQPGLRYVAVAEDLQRQIESGQIKDGERLPSQHQMARTYGVSLTTLRSALSLLEQRGYIRTSHGLGTFASMPAYPARTALVVDDDPGAIALIRAILEGEDIEAVGVSSVEAAVEQVSARDFDVIFLDLVMPDASGMDALDTFEQMGIAAPVVIVTGVADTRMINMAVARRPLTLIRKPVSVRQVRQVLERIGLITL